VKKARVRIVGLVLVVSAATSATVFTQGPPSPSALTFEVVSIKRTASGAIGANGSALRPDGGFIYRNASIPVLIQLAYPSNVPTPLSLLSGLPEWARLRGESYDIIAKSPLSRPATPEERAAMARVLLTDRFKLAVHLESREQPVYDLIFARSDHRLGPNIKPSEPGCDETLLATRRDEMLAAVAPGRQPPSRPLPGRDGHVASCVPYLGRISADEGDITVQNLATNLSVQLPVQRPVIDKTGLTGLYRIRLSYDMRASVLGLEAVPNPTGPPPLFTALQDQLGLKLESSKIMRDTVVVDHIERPTED
jgi:uncharacterized protein (TIGR03435 family)